MDSDTETAQDKLRDLHRRIVDFASQLAVFLVYDRPSRVEDRPALVQTHFAHRCVAESQLNAMIESLRDIGVYVELLDGDLDFIRAVSAGRLQAIPRSHKLVYNGVEGGIGVGGFEPGRKALVPAVADAFGLVASNSNAYACAVGRHKFHYFTLLNAQGIRVPAAWHFRLDSGWQGGARPTPGTTVIVKSTYESWSVGVSETSVFVYDSQRDDQVRGVAASIGQDVCVQEFVAGPEVCVPVYAIPERFTTAPVQAILTKAPRDPHAVMTFEDTSGADALRHDPYPADAPGHEEMLTAAVRSFDALQLGAFARIDFRVDASGLPWVIDVGVSPGVGPKSSAFRSACAEGLSYEEFIRVAMAATLADRGLLP